MKNAMIFIALFAVLIVSTSAHTERVYKAEDGFKAPWFEVASSDSVISLSDLEGRYVLINFWSSTDARSRMSAIDYDKLFQSTDDERFCLLSVNLDRSERLFREIVRRDNLSAESQFFAERSDVEKLSADYGLSHGLQSFLVNPEGMIVATNPSIEALENLMSR